MLPTDGTGLKGRNSTAAAASRYLQPETPTQPRRLLPNLWGQDRQETRRKSALLSLEDQDKSRHSRPLGEAKMLEHPQGLGEKSQQSRLIWGSSPWICLCQRPGRVSLRAEDSLTSPQDSFFVGKKPAPKMACGAKQKVTTNPYLLFMKVLKKNQQQKTCVLFSPKGCCRSFF